MFGRLWGLVRGTVAWLVGYLLTLLLAAVGVVETETGLLGEAAGAFVHAHVMPPGAASADPLVLAGVPVLALGAIGYRAGTRRQSGVVGRVRSFLASLRDDDRSRARAALRSGVTIAVGYGLLTAVVALALQLSAGTIAVSAFLTGVVVAVPAAYVGANR